MTQASPLYSLNRLRASQRDVVIGENKNRMGISAVPGSGKTHTLSFMAADIIISGFLELRQEVLIVTLSNSAVNNFAQKIGDLIRSDGLLAGMGYRVRTLHGLAHDIVRERPGLVNLSSDFAIIDEREANAIREQIALAWLRSNPTFFDGYLREDLDGHTLNTIRERELPRLVQNVALSLIRYAKDQELTPEMLAQRLDGLPMPLPLAEMGCVMYQEYQRSLNYRGAVDFDDLIRLALSALRADPRLTERLRYQWPYILEDEAQDSSRLQELILRTLSGENGHWVRVGDPNQAIYETFTTANPHHLLNFISTPEVTRRELPVSGRSSRKIIRLANTLIDWVRIAHPVSEARDALHLPHIQPTEQGDPQLNPPDDASAVYFSSQRWSPGQEMENVIRNLVQWQNAQNEKPEDERETLAVLDLQNIRGAEIAEALRRRGIEPVELLHTTPSTRLSSGALADVMRCMASPQSPALLTKAFRTWVKRRPQPAATEHTRQAAERIRGLRHVEDYLYPLPGQDWLENLAPMLKQETFDLLVEFRGLARRWHAAALLPIDQALLTIAQDLFFDAADLAIAHKLAGVLRQASDNHPTWRLPELSGELETIAKNKRRFLGFSEDETAFEPERFRGRIVITTMHKAKGLEWDRVYLLSVNNYNFPSGQEYDVYYAEKYFLRSQLNLEAEALAQLKTALSNDEYHWYQEGQATQEARLDCIRERLRLLYVGITRAKKTLIVTWNTGRRNECVPALPFQELSKAIE
jgi:DNA helicase II / ATP-dependent DNA helicase PcrA